MLLKTPGSLVTRSFGWRPKEEQSVSQDRLRARAKHRPQQRPIAADEQHCSVTLGGHALRAAWSAFPPSAQLLLSDNDFSGYFGRSFWPGSERLRDNRRMTDAAHNQHSETRRPSDRDRIVTTGPSRFQPARPEVLR